MKLTRIPLDEFLIVEITGIVDSHAAGTLSDALIESVEDGWKKIVVDLSGARSVTHAGVRGLIVAAKLLKNGRGQMRLCGANRATDSLLRGLGFHHLLKCDPTIELSVLALSMADFPQPQKPATRPARAKAAPRSGCLSHDVEFAFA